MCWRTGAAWPRTDLSWCIAALLVLTATSLVVSRDVRGALPKVTTLVFGIAWFFALVRWRRAGLTAQTLAMMLGAACLGLAVAGAFGSQWLTKVPAIAPLTSWFSQVSSDLRADRGLSPNAFAGTLLLLIPLCIAPLSTRWDETSAGPGWLGRLQRRTSMRRAIAGSALFVALVFLLLAQSRGGWLGALLAALTLMLYRVRAFRRVPLAAVVLVGGLACVIVAFWAAIPGHSSLGPDLVGKWEFRQEMWWLGRQFIRDFPWTGVGFNGFRHLAVVLYASSSAASGMDIVHPHNMWLSVGVDLGIPGIIVYLAVWVMAFRRPLQIQRTGGPAEVRIGQCLVASWVGFWVFGIADAIPLGSKLGTVLWFSLALGQMLAPQTDA